MTRQRVAVVQAASVDEFYLDLGGTERLFDGETLADTAERIRREVLDRTEISVSIGGGTAPSAQRIPTSRVRCATPWLTTP